MDRNEFYKYVEKEIKKYLPEKYHNTTIVVQEMESEGRKLGVGFAMVEEGKTNIPMLDMERYYQSAKDKDTLEESLKKLAQEYVGLYEGPEKTSSIEMTKQEFLENLHTTVINFAKNRDVLCNVPYFKLNDLAVIPMLQFPDGNSHPLSMRHVKMLGISEDALLATAMQNNARLHLPVLRKMSMADERKNRKSVIPLDNQAQLENNRDFFVLTTEQGVNGASLLADKSVLDRVQKKLGDDFYLIPDNIHELVVIPACLVDDPKDLRDVLKLRNQDLRPDAVLSENVYRYSGKNRSLEMYDGSFHKEKAHAREETDAR